VLQLNKYSGVILKMENEISRLKSEVDELTNTLSVKSTEIELMKATTSHLQKAVVSEKTANNSQVSRENELRLDIKRLEMEKNEFYAQIKRLEVSVESQLKRESDLIRKFREKESFLEQEKAQIESQVKGRNKIVEEILKLQSDQQTEIAQLQLTIEEARKSREWADRDRGEEAAKLSKEKNELEAKVIRLEEAVKGHHFMLEGLEGRLKEEFEADKERLNRDLKARENETKRLRKENTDMAFRQEEEQRERALLGQQFEEEVSKMKLIEDKRNQKEALLNTEIETLKAELSQNRKRADFDEERKLKGELEDRRIEVESLKLMLRVEQNEKQERARLFEAEKDELRKRILRAEMKNEEAQGQIESRDKLQRTRQELEKLKGDNDKMGEENEQFVADLKRYKAKIKMLAQKNDELKSENQFFESKIEKLEKKMMDMIYQEQPGNAKGDENTSKLKAEVQSWVKRTQEQKQKAVAIVQRVPRFGLSQQHSAQTQRQH
jgi:chromosome segregation ATPase